MVSDIPPKYKLDIASHTYIMTGWRLNTLSYAWFYDTRSNYGPNCLPLIVQTAALSFFIVFFLLVVKMWDC